jgi:DNA-directed RNA polymerase subunit omega
MDLKDILTNEKLVQRFNSQFQLVNYAIALAGSMMKSGRPPRVKCDIQNPVHYVLSEILNNKDSFEEDEQDESEEEAEHAETP